MIHHSEARKIERETRTMFGERQEGSDEKSYETP